MSFGIVLQRSEAPHLEALVVEQLRTVSFWLESKASELNRDLGGVIFGQTNRVQLES